MNRKRARYIWNIVRQGPTETGYAFFRARRRRRNLADEELELSPSDRVALAADFDVTQEQLDASSAVVDEYMGAGRLDVSSIQWFVPSFHLVFGGGIYTLLRFADHFAREHGVENRFCLYDAPSDRVAGEVAAKIGSAFPALRDAPVFTDETALPDADAAFATEWSSAYPLVRFNRTRAKLFFVQDWEPDFFPAGSASALLDQAARLGIPGVVNTPGLADVYRAHGSPAVSFTPAVDTTRYHRAIGPRGSGPVRVFFYGRPASPRNAFGLGLAALRLVKQRHGDAVEIVSAGEDWNPGQYGMSDVLDNRGMLEDLDAVARLYRSCEIGLVFMLTKHPSYLPLEFMASGVATVSNRNPHTAWLLRHEENALLSNPLPALVADQVGRLVEDPALRERLVAAGLEQVSGVHWEDEMERVWEAITAGGSVFTTAPETTQTAAG